MTKEQFTIYLTDVVDGWVAWDGYTWDENSGAVLDKDRDAAIERFKSGLLSRSGYIDLSLYDFTILED
jgi:hypothetical protein